MVPRRLRNNRSRGQWQDDMPDFTPDADDDGTVRAVATYTDAGGESRTVSKSVIVQKASIDQNAPPTFASGSDARTVKENMRGGTNVGGPVKATDADTGDNSRLTYTLTGGDGNFEHQPFANGQLTTTRRTEQRRDDSD